MAAGQILIPEAMPSRDSNGRAVVSRLYFYQNGTTLPAVVYSASNLTTPLVQPVEASAEGRWPAIWADKATVFTVSWTTATGQLNKTYTGIQAGDGYVVYDDFAHRDLGNVSGNDFRSALTRSGLIPMQDQLSNLYGLFKSLCNRICSVTSVVFNGAALGLDLRNYISTSAALSNTALQSYPDTSGWTDVSSGLRQAFYDAALVGLPVDASRLKGVYYIDPATVILILQGSGFIGPIGRPCQVNYVTVGGVLKQQINYPGLTFVVDCHSAYKDIPWFAQQGGTSVTGLQVVGFGLIEDVAGMNVSAYPTITGAPTDHAPIIVTDHRHDSAGALTSQAKAGNTYLQAHIVGVMQSCYRGDPLLSEEPWCASVASGSQTGLSLTEVHLSGFALKRTLGAARTTGGGIGLKVTIKDNPVFWTAITQPNSGGLGGSTKAYALLKWKQQNCHIMEMWHRAVGFEIDIDARNARYALQLQAGYSPDGPTYAAPDLNVAVAVGTVISGTDGNVFRASVAGDYTTQPIASGANYNAATKLFTDPGSALRWDFICARQDTGKYNAAKIKIGGERLTTYVRVEHNAYLHRVRFTFDGHSMDYYNPNEPGSTVEIRTDGRIAGAIDKAVYDLAVVSADYAIGAKVSDGSNNVFACLQAGTCTVTPTPSGGNYNSTTKVFTDPGSSLLWVFRNAGFKPMGSQAFAVSYFTGVLQESPRRLFSGNVYDGHLYHEFNEFSNSIWAQPKTGHADACFYNPSLATVLIHANSNANASGNSKRVYDVANPQNLVVGSNRYYGQVIPVDGLGAPTGVFPTAIGGNLLDSFWTGKNCLAFSAGVAQGDDEGDDDNG